MQIYAQCQIGNIDNKIYPYISFSLIYLTTYIGRTQVLFVGPLTPVFWTSSDVCPGFQNKGGCLACMLPHLCTINFSDSPLV